MKYFFKVFSIAFLCFALALGAGLFTYYKISGGQPDEDQIDVVDSENENNEENNDKDNEDKEIKDPLKKAISESKRVNVALLGMEGPRTDTILLASFDPVTKKVDVISIPRDTYFYRKGYEASDKRKINAVYGDAGVKGTMKAIENVLGGVPVDHYVKVSYNGVEKIVDALGGVEVNVPFHMVYEDTTPGQPPLYIDIPKGKQILKGENAVKFLRYRKSNDGKSGYSDGDLGRMAAQQDFMKSAIKKALSFRLPAVVNATFRYVDTDMTLQDILVYVNGAMGIEAEDIDMHILPGSAKYKNSVSYFMHDPNQVKELIMKIYGVEEVTAEDSNESENE